MLFMYDASTNSPYLTQVSRLQSGFSKKTQNGETHRKVRSDDRVERDRIIVLMCMVRLCIVVDHVRWCIRIILVYF